MATTKKITDLDALTEASNTDLLYVVHDPAGVPTSNKISVQDLFKKTVSVGPAPATSTSPGVRGQMIANSIYLYVCTETNKWIRTQVTLSW